MGFFSWKTSDTDKSISNVYSARGAFPVYVLIPEEFGGGSIKEKCYGGYGEFGGRDIYALVAQWNRPAECKCADGNFHPDEKIRDIGIDIACGSQRNAGLKYPIKITEYPMQYKDAKPSADCEYQGYFYPETEGDEWEECD